jgi:hypothetical protein
MKNIGYENSNKIQKLPQYLYIALTVVAVVHIVKNTG